MVSGPDGTDTLTGIEHLQFADGTHHVVDDGNALFDTLYYLSRNPDVFHAGVNALDHFNTFGWHEGRDPNAFFDTSGYLAVNQDVAAAGVNPLDHYHQSGWHEGRDPSATSIRRSISSAIRTWRRPASTRSRTICSRHGRGPRRLRGGRAEHRRRLRCRSTTCSTIPTWRRPASIRCSTSTWSAGSEGRDPNAWFDTAGYLSHYTDVAAAGINPLQHYEPVGWKEGRDPSADFDTLGYLAAISGCRGGEASTRSTTSCSSASTRAGAPSDGVWH